jgi:hypothetical protein
MALLRLFPDRTNLLMLVKTDSDCRVVLLNPLLALRDFDAKSMAVTVLDVLSHVIPAQEHHEGVPLVYAGAVFDHALLESVVKVDIFSAIDDNAAPSCNNVAARWMELRDPVSRVFSCSSSVFDSVWDSINNNNTGIQHSSFGMVGSICCDCFQLIFFS